MQNSKNGKCFSQTLYVDNVPLAGSDTQSTVGEEEGRYDLRFWKE
jgi:hypothetical protein